jgi:phosphonoacetaldehyde hydrolase
VAERWMQTHGKAATDSDIDRMYKAFTPMQTKAVVDYCVPIKGWCLLKDVLCIFYNEIRFCRVIIKHCNTFKTQTHSILGVPEAVKALRSRAIKIGSCTGFPMDVVNVLKTKAAEHGYAPDCYVAADEVRVELLFNCFIHKSVDLTPF